MHLVGTKEIKKKSNSFITKQIYFKWDFKNFFKQSVLLAIINCF